MIYTEDRINLSHLPGGFKSFGYGSTIKSNKIRNDKVGNLLINASDYRNPELRRLKVESQNFLDLVLV